MKVMCCVRQTKQHECIFLFVRTQSERGSDIFARSSQSNRRDPDTRRAKWRNRRYGTVHGIPLTAQNSGNALHPGENGC